MQQVYVFTLTTREKHYEKGDLVFDTSGTDIGRVLRRCKVILDEADIFYLYDIESTQEMYEKLKNNEIAIYKIDKFSVHPCSIAYMEVSN